MAPQCAPSRAGSSPLTAILYGLLLVAGFELYHLISAWAPRRVGLAHQHALHLIDLERRLGLLLEPGAQRTLLGSGTPLAQSLRLAVTTIYAGGQIPWLAAMLSWLYLFSRPSFRPLCLVVLVGSFVGILFAGMYPVAPPRFALAGVPYGLQDFTGIPSSERALVLSAGFNPFASMPSIHVLWACFTGFGLWLGAPSRAPRWAVLAFPLAVTLAVVLTGNHYILDCLASFALFGCFVGLYRLVAGRGHAAGAATLPALAREPIVPWPALLRRPTLLAGLVGVLLACANAGWERLPGLLVLLATCAAVVLASRKRVSGVPLPARAALFDWYAGLLLVAGATAAVTGDGYPRLVASALWLIAAALPFYGRLRRPFARTWAWTSRRAPGYRDLDMQPI